MTQPAQPLEGQLKIIRDRNAGNWRLLRRVLNSRGCLGRLRLWPAPPLKAGQQALQAEWGVRGWFGPPS